MTHIDGEAVLPPGAERALHRPGGPLPPPLLRQDPQWVGLARNRIRATRNANGLPPATRFSGDAEVCATYSPIMLPRQTARLTAEPRGTEPFTRAKPLSHHQAADCERRRPRGHAQRDSKIKASASPALPRSGVRPPCVGIEQGFSTILVPRPFNAAPRAVVTPRP